MNLDQIDALRTRIREETRGECLEELAHILGVPPEVQWATLLGLVKLLLEESNNA